MLLLRTMSRLSGDACTGFRDSTLPAFPQKSAARLRKPNIPIDRPYQLVLAQSEPDRPPRQAADLQNDSVVNIGEPAAEPNLQTSKWPKFGRKPQMRFISASDMSGKGVSGELSVASFYRFSQGARRLRSPGILSQIERLQLLRLSREARSLHD